MNPHNRVLPLILLFSAIAIGCNSDDSIPPAFLCCGENPFTSSNVDNLDSLSVEINVFEVFTPNGDGINDFFLIQNIEFHPSNSVTIFDLSDNIVFERQSYFSGDPFIGKNSNTGAELAFGSYKYKIVLENEQTFVEFGYVCLLKDKSEANNFDFSSCNLINKLFTINDPVFN